MNQVDDKGTLQEEHVRNPNIMAWRQDLLNKVLRVISLAGLPFAVVGSVFLYNTQNWPMLVLGITAYLVAVGGMLFPQIPYRGRLYGLLGALFVMAIIDMSSYGPMEDTRLYMILIIFFAAIFEGRQIGNLTLWVMCGVLLLFSAALVFGWVTPLMRPGHSFNPLSLFITIAIFLMVGYGMVASLNYLFPRMIAAWEQSQQMSQELEKDRVRLAERTQALQEANINLQHRAMYLEASLHVSHALASIFELKPLLERAVNLIAEHFDFYHTAIFVVDEDETWADLAAASSVGGREMLARGYRLRHGGESIVGWVLENRQSCLAFDEGKAAAYFQNPNLPAAHSAIVLPLMVEERMVGVLDIQSAEPNAFDQDDLRALEGLAGQLAVALNNAKHMAEEAALLEAASPLYRLSRQLATARTEREVYTALLDVVASFNPAHVFVLRTKDVHGHAHIAAEMRHDERSYQSRPVGLSTIPYIDELLVLGKALPEPLLVDDLTLPFADVQSNFEDVRLGLLESTDTRSLALIPIRVETEMLGVLVASYDTAHPFSNLEMQIYRVMVNLGGVALERMQLLQDAQSRLDQERWIREFGERVMRIPNLESMVAQAAQSLLDVVQADGVMVSLAASENE